MKNLFSLDTVRRHVTHQPRDIFEKLVIMRSGWESRVVNDVTRYSNGCGQEVENDYPGKYRLLCYSSYD